MNYIQEVERRLKVEHCKMEIAENCSDVDEHAIISSILKHEQNVKTTSEQTSQSSVPSKVHSAFDENCSSNLSDEILMNSTEDEYDGENYISMHEMKDVNVQRDTNETVCMLQNKKLSGGLFQLNTFFNSLPIRIIGTANHPMFYADDLGRILKIKRMRNEIRSFSTRELVAPWQRELEKIETFGGDGKRYDRIILLSEFGVYRLLVGSKSELGEQFREWIYSVLYRIRTEGIFKYESDKIEQLQICNEKLLAKNGQLAAHIQQLNEKQEAFKNFCERIHIFEKTNDPKIRYLSKNLDPEDIDSDDSCDEECSYIDDWEGYQRDFPEDASYRLHSYKLTSTPTANDFACYNVVYSIYVRDARVLIKSLSEKLFRFTSSKSSDTCRVFFCPLEMITSAINTYTVRE